MNVDSVPLPGVNHVIDFDAKPPHLPFDDDAVAYSEGVHILEHLRDPLPFMEELWRVTKPGGRAVFRCPYGSTDDADEDPTHVRRMFPGSWGYFSQPYYWRADYGYRGDWQPDAVTLFIFPDFAGLTDTQLWSMVRLQRNVVAEMEGTLRCVKPARAQDRALQGKMTITLART